MVSVKKSTIFSRVFFSKTGQEIVLSYDLKRNEASEDDKNVNYMGVFQQNRPKNTGSYGLERKESCEDDKNVNFVKSKTWVFSKGVNR